MLNGRWVVDGENSTAKIKKSKKVEKYLKFLVVKLLIFLIAFKIIFADFWTFKNTAKSNLSFPPDNFNVPVKKKQQKTLLFLSRIEIIWIHSHLHENKKKKKEKTWKN